MKLKQHSNYNVLRNVAWCHFHAICFTHRENGMQSKQNIVTWHSGVLSHALITRAIIQETKFFSPLQRHTWRHPICFTQHCTVWMLIGFHLVKVVSHLSPAYDVLEQNILSIYIITNFMCLNFITCELHTFQIGNIICARPVKPQYNTLLGSKMKTWNYDLFVIIIFAVNYKCTALRVLVLLDWQWMYYLRWNCTDWQTHNSLALAGP